jgi:hypothetical protein
MKPGRFNIRDAYGSHVDRSGFVDCLPLWSVRQLFAGAVCRGSRLVLGLLCFKFGAVFPNGVHDHG